MKKIVIIAVLILMCVPSLFGALRLGVEIGNPSVVLIVRPEPFDIKIGWNFEQSFVGHGRNFLHVSADYRIVDAYRLIDFLHFFLGLGAYAQVYTGDETTFGIGGRVPVGLNVFLVNKTIEFFIEYAFNITFIPAFGLDTQGQGYVGITIKTPW
ncbi:MAG: hypothetical protein JW969_18165 [Spirochaetales bacterium]|nr:hypothetical protein [Spirochaetales bacterium]